MFFVSYTCAICYVFIYYHLFYSWELPHYHRGKNYTISAQVIKVYDTDQTKIANKKLGSYFKARLLKLNNKIVSQTVYINLAWYQAKTDVNKNDIITAKARLKPYRSLQNFGNNNPELNAFYKHIKAKGYINTKYLIQIIKGEKTHFDHLKHNLATSFDKSENKWFYHAILFGDKSYMPSENYRELNALGISHLFAISGLHIGMMFAIGFYFSKMITIICYFNKKQSSNLNYCHIGLGICFALIYTLISGCAISAVRAFIMLCIFCILYLKGYKYLSKRALMFALLLSLLINPFQLLNPGIYFSFLAVFILINTYSRLNLDHNNFITRIQWLIILQVSITLGLLPLVWFFNDGASLIGIVINLVAIPIMALYVLPSIVICSFLSVIGMSDFHLYYLDKSITLILKTIHGLDSHIYWYELGDINWQTLVLIYLFLYLLTTALRIYAYLPLVILITNKTTELNSNWQIDILDVGHGLSVLVTQNKNTYVYDLGARYQTGVSIASTQVLPYIAGQNFNIVHTMISHKDNDHAGGLVDWYKYGLGSTILVNINHDNEIENCVIGQTHFGDLTIENLWPRNKSKLSNNNSCVVRVTDGNFSILLPGDIHKKVEKDLIDSFVDLKSTILISPHHGSKTSSSINFIKAVSPQWVIHSSALNGRWVLPNLDIVQRYANLGAQQLTTGTSGHIRIKVNKDKYHIESMRNKQSYWFLVN